jgi:putative ABC transport system ATP-binding protein
MLPAYPSGENHSVLKKKALTLLDLFGISSKAALKVESLSGGEAQRVTIARALVNRPAIVWGDEPTGDLDSETSRDIMDLLCVLNEKNDQTFVLVTHSQEVAERTHRIVRMRDGLIVDGQ